MPKDLAPCSGVGEGASFARGSSRVRPTSCPTQSEFFADAMRGMENRMGHDSNADHGVSIEALVKCINLVRQEATELAADPDSQTESNQLFKLGAFICITAGRNTQSLLLNQNGVM